MSTKQQQQQGQNGFLDGQGLNEAAASQITAGTREQLEANSAEERDEIRANATSLPPAALDLIDDAVFAPMYEQLVLVQMFENATQDLTHDLRWWETETSWGIQGRMNEAEHSSDLVSRSEEGDIGYGREGIAVPYTIKDYRIPESQMARAQATGTSLDTSYANAAGQSNSELLEDTMLYGSRIQLTNPRGYQLGCPGMMNVQGRVQFPATGTWADGPTAKDDVLEAIGQLKDRKFYPVGNGLWLLVGTKQDTFFNQDYEDNVASDDTTREKIEAISDIDQVAYVPRIPDGEAILMVPSPQVIDMARLPDGPINLSWETNGGMVNQFKIYQLLAPRIKHNQDGNTGIVHFAGAGTGEA